MSSINFDRFDKSIDTNVVHSVKAIAEFSQINYLDKIFSDDNFLHVNDSDTNNLNSLFFNDLDKLIYHENFDMSRIFDLDICISDQKKVSNILGIKYFLS